MEEKNLWSSGRRNLEYLKLRYFNYQVTTNYKICIKKHKCELYKTPGQYSGTTTWTKNQRCDTCAYQEKNCQYVRKKYYNTCVIKKRKCVDYKDLPPKCTTNSNFFLNFILLFANWPY